MSDEEGTGRLWALARRLLRRLYWGVIGLIACWIGTPYFEHKWRRRGVAEVRKYFSSLDHPHRKWLMEQFDALYPFNSVLEVGCACGPNVQLLARKFPDIEVQGIDINPIWVREGNARLAELGIEHARLIIGKADDLSQFADQSIDVVFTDATLLYFSPDKISKVISEMKRIPRWALLSVELFCLCLWWHTMSLVSSRCVVG